MFGLHGSLELYLFAFVVLVLLAAWYFTGRRVNSPNRRPRDAIAASDSAFLIKPYLQLGDQPKHQAMESVELLWHTASDSRRWQVQVKLPADADWRPAVTVNAIAADISKLGKHKRFQVTLDKIPPGSAFEYRLLADGAVAFGAKGKVRSGPDQPFTAVVVGDFGKSEDKEMQPVAFRIGAELPDFIMAAGDMVYDRGRVSEYLDDLFAVYNFNYGDPKKGAPLLRSRILMPDPGNHDVALPGASDKRDFTAFKDLLGYYLFWSVPMNGPQRIGSANAPSLQGDEAQIKRFLAAAGDRFPRIGCYSFDWGNSHWTNLDSNAYMNWADKDLVAWVENDLSQARSATWRFVVYHHPSFSSDGKHAAEQRMRLLAPIFERYQVDVVFTGHNHCYERSFPVRFRPDNAKSILPLHTEDTPVAGTFEVDQQFDGVTHTQPNGVVYIVDGAGGAVFYAHSQPEHLKPFTQVYDQSQHSFTYISINRKRMEAVQIGANGAEIDRFVIDKT
jgi:hypothetical protein